ncbi:MAG TPA: glycosyltransferase family 2 protein [Chitinispirillaceae bacterium]|nr:glycosyltransferase family 2 protein [Chitinispirillaceae bacterium]
MKLSVIIPVFNEEKNIEPLISGLHDALPVLGNYEVIIVDDGSTDDTLNQLKAAAQWFPALKIVKLNRNYGKTTAYNAGFRHCSGQVIATMDGDLQDDPADIAKLVQKLSEGYDLVKGWKNTGKGTIPKTIASKLFNMLVYLLTGTRFHDMNCPVRVMTRVCMKRLRLHGDLYRFIPFIAHTQGFKIAEVPIGNSPRLNGQSKYGLARFFKGFFDLITVYFLVHFQESPLHLFGTIGGLLLLSGFLIDLALVINGLFFTGVIGHFALLLMGILFMLMGIQLVGIGLIGELVINTRKPGIAELPVEMVFENQSCHSETVENSCLI